MVAVLARTGKAVNGELQGVEARHRGAAMVYIQAAGEGFAAAAAILLFGGTFKAHVGATIAQGTTIIQLGGNFAPAYFIALRQ